jgi:site-specific recombinase XerD
MNFAFSLSKDGINKNICLSIDNNQFENPCYFLIPLIISGDEWDNEKQRPKNIYLKAHKEINRKLDSIKVDLTEYIKNIPAKKKITKKKISDIIKKKCTEEEVYPVNTLLYFVSQYINSRKELICHSTYKRYKVFRNLIARFEGFIKNRITISNVNCEFIKYFITFGKQESYNENTLYRTLNFIKTILNFVEKKGIATSIREFEFKRIKEEKEVITLSEEEISLIKNTEVSTALQDSKDWLLISCFTGQRISDFMNFTNDKLLEIDGRLCINFIQQKTNKKILLPLHPAVIEIIKSNNDSFPKLINAQLYNKNIKKIGKLAQINETIKAKKRIGHRAKSLLVEKWEILTSHIGRRSFATNFYGKIPTPLLIAATGHGSEQMFLKYINSFDKDQILCLSNYFDTIYKQQLS